MYNIFGILLVLGCLGVLSYILRMIVVEHLRVGRLRKYYRNNCKEKKMMDERYVVSEELLEFLKEWLEWASARNCKSNKVFNQRLGLCGCLNNWCYTGRSKFEAAIMHTPLSRELKQLFPEQGYHPSYPFGVSNFVNRREEGSQHQDPERLLWVNKTIKTTEEFLHENRH